MSIQRRFYAPSARQGELVPLPDDEAQHLTRVLRLGAGDEVAVFDGRGHEFSGVVEFAAKAGVSIRIGASRESAPEPSVAVTLAQAVLKGDKMDDVVRDAVMMGVAAIQPIVTARTEVSLASLARARREERWQRVAVSSAKQCGRAVVPVVLSPITFEALLAGIRALAVPGPALLCTEPSASSGAVALGDLDLPPPHEATLVIGPEGGWTTAELESADACRLVTLGRRTLRADAMPLVALAALFAIWREF
jgi:16S rRNA (uracil1498-N3)-methyltransferase